MPTTFHDAPAWYRRAPAIGHSGMRVHLLYQTLYHNHRATIAHGLRHGKQPLIT